MKNTKIKKDLSKKTKKIGSGSKIRGITLIALVITIVIILILASITIALLKNVAMVDKAKNASNQSKVSMALEELKLKVAEIQIEKKGEATLEDVVEGLNNDPDNEYIISLNEVAQINGIIPNVAGKSEIFVIYKNIEFKITSELEVILVKNSVSGVRTQNIVDGLYYQYSNKDKRLVLNIDMFDEEGYRRY